MQVMIFGNALDFFFGFFLGLSFASRYLSWSIFGWFLTTDVYATCLRNFDLRWSISRYISRFLRCRPIYSIAAASIVDFP